MRGSTYNEHIAHVFFSSFSSFQPTTTRSEQFILCSERCKLICWSEWRGTRGMMCRYPLSVAQATLKNLHFFFNPFGAFLTMFSYFPAKALKNAPDTQIPNIRAVRKPPKEPLEHFSPLCEFKRAFDFDSAVSLHLCSAAAWRVILPPNM